MQNLKDLELLLKSSVPIVTIESQEEKRVRVLFEHVITHMKKPLYRWTITDGLRREQQTDTVSRQPRLNEELRILEINNTPVPATSYENKPLDLLNLIKLTRVGGIYLLFDFHPYLDDPIVVRHIKDIATNHAEVPHTIVLISHELKIPQEVDHFCAHFELSSPDRAQLETIVRMEAQVWSKMNKNMRIVVEKKILNQLVESLLGLPLDDVRRLVRGAIRDDGVLTESEVKEVMKAKFDLLSQGGILSFEYDTARYADVGGLNNLKDWLALRKASFTGEISNPGLDAPKGIMLLGVQGCGKSLAAKAVAGAPGGVPLLRLDFGSIYNKFFGESEKNLRAPH